MGESERIAKLETRVDQHEEQIRELSNVHVALTRVTDKVDNVEKDVTEMKTDIKEIKDKPAKKWENFTWLIFTTIVGAIIGGLIGKFCI